MNIEKPQAPPINENGKMHERFKRCNKRGQSTFLTSVLPGHCETFSVFASYEPMKDGDKIYPENVEMLCQSDLDTERFCGEGKRKILTIMASNCQAVLVGDAGSIGYFISMFRKEVPPPKQTNKYRRGPYDETD